MKTIIILTLLILVGCSSEICSLGWSNETHFCNEYHNKEERWINESFFISTNLTATLRITKGYFFVINCVEQQENLTITFDYEEDYYSYNVTEICDIIESRERGK